jgi:predicted CoA-substrate-specific enzyme activase
MICAGVDAGSRSIKVVLIDSDALSIAASGIMDQGIQQTALAHQLFEEVLQKAHIDKDDVQRTVATGYGRTTVDFADTTITEITCHATGVRHLVPDAMTIIEIGGQDSKLLRLNENGSVRDFAMNDRCAAGTGRFLEMVASRIGVTLKELGEFAARSSKPASISSMCVVFAETEIIGLLASGVSPEDIVAGVQGAIAQRVSSMVGRTVTPPVIFTGGVALIPGMDTALKAVLDHGVSVAPEPQMTGALGAALLACRQSS